MKIVLNSNEHSFEQNEKKSYSKPSLFILIFLPFPTKLFSFFNYFIYDLAFLPQKNLRNKIFNINITKKTTKKNKKKNNLKEQMM
jgi:hypothetical protein